MRAATVRREPGEVFGPRLALFSDMLAVGLLATLASLPLVTAPSAFAAACAVLRDAARTERTATAARYLAALRAHGPRRTLMSGAVLLLCAAVVLADRLLADAGLPGAPLFSAVLTLVSVVALVVGMRAAARPAARRDWPAALRAAAHRSLGDVPGSALLVAALVMCAALVWALPPLALLVTGPLALATVAVEARAGWAASHRPGPPGAAVLTSRRTTRT